MNNDDTVKKILNHAKPDAMQALEMLKEAKSTITMLSNSLKFAEARWTEIFIILATVLVKFDKEIVLGEEDMISLSPHDYQVTVEPDEENNTRIVRLRHVSEKEE